MEHFNWHLAVAELRSAAVRTLWSEPIRAALECHSDGELTNVDNFTNRRCEVSVYSLFFFVDTVFPIITIIHFFSLSLACSFTSSHNTQEEDGTKGALLKMWRLCTFLRSVVTIGACSRLVFGSVGLCEEVY